MWDRPIIPRPLADRDLLYVAHAAGRVDPRLLDDGVAKLRDAGVSVRLDPTLGQEEAYLSASDSRRRDDLVSALENPDIGIGLQHHRHLAQRRSDDVA